jgi:HlyD family secretion protein
MEISRLRAAEGRPRARVAIAAAMVIAAVVAVALRGGGGLEVVAATAARDTLTETVHVEGRTRVRDRYVVTAPVGGRLQRLTLEEGDVITQNQVLATIYAALQDPRVAASARAEVQAAEAAHFEAAARVEEARLASAQAGREVERRRPLLDVGALTVEAMEQVELAAAVSARRLVATEAAEEVARAALDGARARLVGGEPGGAAGPTALDVRSPQSGRVLRIPDRSERVVQPGEPVLELANPDGLEVVLEVLTEDAVRVEPGQRLVMTGWGGDRPLSGRIRTITPAGYTKVSALGVEEQRVDVIADLDHVPAGLGAEYRVSGEVAVWQASDVLVIPTTALFRRGETWQVFLVSEGRAQRRDVEVGHASETSAEVTAGLVAGDVVVAFPSSDVDDGVRVRTTTN